MPNFQTAAHFNTVLAGNGLKTRVGEKWHTKRPASRSWGPTRASETAKVGSTTHVSKQRAQWFAYEDH